LPASGRHYRVIQQMRAAAAFNAAKKKR